MAYEFNLNIDGIVQGNNGTVFNFTVKDKGAVVPIVGATVEVTIRRAGEIYVKQAEITDAPNGKCRFVLSNADLTTAGQYYFQPTVFFADGTVYSDDPQKFKVAGKLAGVPALPPSTAPLSVWSRFGVNENGKPTFDGEEIVGTVEDGVWDRFGVNTDGKPTFDGQEIGTGSGEGMTIRDVVSGESFTVSGSTTTPTPTPNTAPVITSSFSPVSVDDKTSIAIPFNISDDSNDALTATYTIDGVSSTVTVSKGSNTWNVGALTQGSRVLTIKVTDVGGLVSNTLSFTVQVTAQVVNVAVTGITINANTLTVTKGNSSQLTATVVPSNATNKAVTWSSSNTAIATVNSSGLVTTVATGNAIITATTTDGSFTATCALTVEDVVVTPPAPTAAIYEESGYLNMPVNVYTWAGITGYADASYIGMGSEVLNGLFDKSATSGDPIIINGFPYVPFVANMPTATYPNEVSTIGTSGSVINKAILKMSVTRGSTSALLATYLKDSTMRMKLKLVAGYKTLSITPNVSNVTTRSSGVTADYEYVKFTYGGSIGDYVPTTTINTFYSSLGKVITSSDYVFSRTFANVRVNADGTIEMLLPKGTLSSLDVAGVSAYLTSANLKIYYV